MEQTLQHTMTEITEIIQNAINTAKLGPKAISTEVGYLYCWYANNKGNRYNTTIILSSSPIRAAKSADQTEGVSSVRVNFWTGKPFISRHNAEILASY